MKNTKAAQQVPNYIKLPEGVRRVEQLKKNAWPRVLPDDDGIRPNGPTDRCFYCAEAVGSPHGRDCVQVTKRVLIRYTVDIEVYVPRFWSRQDVAAFYNNTLEINVLADAEKFAEAGGHLNGEAQVIETVDNGPLRRPKEWQ